MGQFCLGVSRPILKKGKPITGPAGKGPRHGEDYALRGGSPSLASPDEGQSALTRDSTFRRIHSAGEGGFNSLLPAGRRGARNEWGSVRSILIASSTPRACAEQVSQTSPCQSAGVSYALRSTITGRNTGCTSPDPCKISSRGHLGMSHRLLRGCISRGVELLSVGRPSASDDYRRCANQ